MNSVARVVVPVAIFIAMGYFVSHSISEFGNDMTTKTQKEGVAAQVKFHQGTLKVTPECSEFKEKMNTINAAATTDDAGKRLLTISAEARGKGCLK
jgi:hypothetical protein